MVTAIADKVVYVPWASWFEDTEFALHYLDTWVVEVCASHDGADIGEAGIQAAFAQPICTPRICDLAAGKRSPAIVVCTAASEGAGFHSLMWPGMALGQNYQQSSPRRAVAPRDMIIFSPGINVNDLSPEARSDVTLCNSWVQVLAALQRKHDDRARVAVFPCSATQISENAVD